MTTDPGAEGREHPQDAVRLHLWDWKGQPDFDSINISMVELFDGAHCPRAVMVPNSHRDEYVLLVSGSPLYPSEAQALWDAWDWQHEEDAGRA